MIIDDIRPRFIVAVARKRERRSRSICKHTVTRRSKPEWARKSRQEQVSINREIETSMMILYNGILL